MRDTARPTQAIEVYRRILARRSDQAAVWNNLGSALNDVGRLDEALASYERAGALQPDNSKMLGNRLYLLHYHPGCDAAAILHEARRWNSRFGRPLADQIPVHANDPAPERRLRIGYVSSEFRGHCLALFFTPLLSHHDHERFEIFCYANVTGPDAVTGRLQSYADVWRDISQLDDQAAAKMIQSDQIDILVDTNLHMAGNRAQLFARKPAPIQVTWLGYPGTTGMDAIDYRLTDPRLDPPGMQEFYAERSVRLPDSFWCYDPRGMEATLDASFPTPGPLPALSAGYVTFGCLNNLCKVSEPTLRLWAGVMAAMPRSQLILLAAPGPHRERLVHRLGVAPHRVHFVPFQTRRQYLETYRRIDLCLDTIPYNGHTTSLDAMWMGVPVVTLMGRTVVGRAGLSHLHNLGLMELLALTEDHFVKLVMEWAGDLDRLGAMRATLRQLMERSPLMDGRRFAGNMEDVFRQMWRAWCRGRS